MPDSARILRESRVLELVTVPHPLIPNLVAIPTGPLPPNPADLLSSHKLAEALRQLRTEYKFIVIDSPPIMAATDAVILSVQTDGVLMVVRSGETPKRGVHTGAGSAGQREMPSIGSGAECG